MNNTNRIFEAMNDLDENYAAEAILPRKKKMKKPLKIAIIVVAAAALALLTGFTTSAVRGRHRFGFYRENSAGHAFDLELTARELTVPKEFMPQEGYHQSFDSVDIPPSELFEMFGLTLPINDNFTEADGEKPAVDVGIVDDNIKIEFNYTLYNKTIGGNVYFGIIYFSRIDNLTYQSNQGLLPGEPAEIITLNDGSLCMVTGSMAVLSLDGAHCTLQLPYDYEIPANIGQMSVDEQYRIVGEMIEAMPGIDTVKQVLTDLEIYTLV